MSKIVIKHKDDTPLAELKKHLDTYHINRLVVVYECLWKEIDEICKKTKLKKGFVFNKIIAAGLKNIEVDVPEENSNE